MSVIEYKNLIETRIWLSTWRLKLVILLRTLLDSALVIT